MLFMRARIVGARHQLRVIVCGQKMELLDTIFHDMHVLESTFVNLK